MELKPVIFAWPTMNVAAINRTRMELKLTLRNCYLLTSLWLSIAPEWNWNFPDLSAAAWNGQAINRTRMELKLGDTVEWYQGILLSIAPEWNWNVNIDSPYLYQTLLSIAPEWNWNFCVFAWMFSVNCLSIAPEWNWNSSTGMVGIGINNYQSHQNGIETDLGLHPICFECLYQSHQNGIETPWNQVHYCVLHFLSIAPEWNWNVIEFLNTISFYILSIAPEWNWNKAEHRRHYRQGDYQSHQNGIETF